MKHDIRCARCNKFVAYADLMPGGGGSWVFVPDSYMTYEEDKVACKTCTDKMGILTPNQNKVCQDKCCGRF